ncbi:hypothetical protein HNY73_019346 [Argiope bruennichi]|uniref:Uncharacterized protein n=1 Tax=Argiope bruennichi TaxID=94029 RepID=A0A8T0EFV6_ARGBR|nr:hypothetical protein HNY73_019346 [Argiope bruennichi]
MTDTNTDEKKSAMAMSQSPGDRSHSRNKSVQWADWELKDVMEFTEETSAQAVIDEYSQTELDINNKDDPLSLVNTLVQTSVEISSLASRGSRSPSLVTCTTMEEEDEKRAALVDLITHLEDTAALLREYLTPIKAESFSSSNIASFEQTTFLLKYQLVLVGFTQLISILLLSLFDHLLEKVHDTGYSALTISCMVILQILNMVLVAFATAVLSKQMLMSKVEGTLMAQTYLATVITMAGLYFMIYRIDPESWDFGSTDKAKEYIAVGQFIKMLYLSVSAATLCGAANIQPNSWYVTLILCFQSLVNFVYFASILAQTIGNYHSYTVQVRRSRSMTHLNS